MMLQEGTPTNKDKGLQGGQYARTEEELYKKALALLEKCRIAPGRRARRYRSWSPPPDAFCSGPYAQTRAAGGRFVVTLRGSGFSGLGTSASLRKVQLRREWSTRLLSNDNEVCLAWLADALQQLRPEGRAKAVGYLEAVLEEVVFEMKMPPKS